MQRHISAQAYYHAMLAEFALVRNELVAAADELQVALVYDSDSSHLTRELASVCLKLGLVDKAGRLAGRALELAPTSADAWLLAAHVQLARGQASAVERSLRRAIELEPGAVAPAVELSRILAKRGHAREAAALLLRNAEAAPRATEPLAELASLEVGRRRLTAAAHALERALARDARSVPIATALGAIYERQARYEEAAVMWRQVTDLVPGDVEALFWAARAQLWADRDDLAEQDVLAIQAQQRGLEVDVRLGSMFLEEGRPARAVELLGECLRVAPSDQRARFAYAIGLAQLGKDEAALAELELISPEHELYVEARIRIGTLLLGLGRFDRVRLSVGAALEHKPSASGLIILQAVALERAGRVGDGLETLREARRDLPADAELAEAEASMMIRAGDRDRGMRTMRAFVESFAVPSEDAQERLASVLERAGEADTAAEVMEKVLRDSAESVPALSFLGRLLAGRALYLGRAERLLRRAVALEPRSGAILDSLGVVCFRRGKLDLAERYLRRASRLMPNDAEVLEHLGDVVLARGNATDSRRAYAAAMVSLERALVGVEPGAVSAAARVKKKLSDLAGSGSHQP